MQNFSQTLVSEAAIALTGEGAELEKKQGYIFGSPTPLEPLVN